MERLEQRALLAVNIINNYTALGENGFVPPDTCGAAGPTSYVETINLDLAIYTAKTTNTPVVSDSLSHFLFTTGGLPRASTKSGLSDPIVVWDDLANRFIVGVQDIQNTTGTGDDAGSGGDAGNAIPNPSDGVSNFDIAVSKSASPGSLGTADWNFYTVNTTETNHDSDYPGNFGYNADAFVFTLRQFGLNGASTQTEVTAIKMSDLVAGNALVTSGAGQNVFQSNLSGIDYRPTVMHDSIAGDPMWLFNSSRSGGSTILVEKMTSVLSTAPVYTPTTLNVNSYSSALIPLNPNGTKIIPGRGGTFTGILKAAEFNNTIVASDTTAVGSNEDDVRWYRIDVSSGTPVLKDQGNVGAGKNTYSVYGAIDINSKGDIGLVYQRSGNDSSTDYMSTYLTGRLATDAAGTMETSVIVPSGTGTTNNTDGREGDLCGINIDSTPLTETAAPAQAATEGTAHTFSLGSISDLEGDFWAAGEFSTTGGGFGTAVAHFAALTPKGPYSIDVDWGDGSTHGTASVSAQGSLGTLSHTYGEEGTKTVTVKVMDTSDNRSDTKTYQVSVSDLPVVQASSIPVSATEGAAFSGVAFATFTDPGGAEPNPSDPTDGIPSHYKVISIDWGDGTPLDLTSGSISYSDGPGSKTAPFTVSGSHTYGEEKPSYTITAIIDHEGQKTTLTSTASVSDPAVQAKGVPVFAVACTPLTGVTLAKFTDPGGAEPNPSDPTDGIPSHYKVVSIDWGDSTPLDTSSGSISFSGTPGSKTDSFTVSGSHTFATEGTFTITVKLDHEGVPTTVMTTAIVKDKLGLLLLDPTGSKSLFVTGNGNVSVTGDCGAVVVDSTASDAVFAAGNATVSAGDFDVTGGGVVTHGNAVVPSPVDNEAPTPDPLGLALPSPLPPPPVGNTATVLNPGTYVGGIQLSGKDAVTLMPGVYVMEGGGFSVSGKASVSGTGVVVINIPGGPSDAISVTGKGVVTLSAPTSGPFKGVAVFQASGAPIGFSGQANVTIAGVFYAPNAPVSITGNAVVTINAGAGTATLPPILAAMIAFDLNVNGNGQLIINADDPPGGAAPAGGSSAAALPGAAVDAVVGGGGLTVPGQLSQQALTDMVVSLVDGAGDPTLGAKKKTS
jgi:hypothetical protein